MVAQKDVSLIGYSFRNASVYPHITDYSIQQHCGDTHEPDYRHNKCPDIERVDTNTRIGGKGFAQGGIGCIVYGGEAAADGRRFIPDIMGIEGLGTGN